MDGTNHSSVSETTLFAIERTRLAHERTLLAWVRTATTLISFGFTLYKFFEYLEQRGPNFARGHWLTAREFGLGMISIGLMALLIATVQHVRDVVRLRSIHPQVPYSLATILALFLSVLGFAALIVVIFRR